MKNEIK